MPVSQGRVSPKELRLHVTLTYAPSNTSAVMDRAMGRTVHKNGRRLGGAAVATSVAKAQVGRQIAEGDLLEMAQRVAGWATGRYRKAGFDLTAAPKRSGTGWKLFVDGPGDAQKWVRILEVGYGPQDTHDFIRKSTKKRAVKVKPGKAPGFYMIIPKVHGKVSRSASGGLVYTPARDDRLGRRVDPDALKQFEAHPLQAALAETFDSAADPDVYRDPEALEASKLGFRKYRAGAGWPYREHHEQGLTEFSAKRQGEYDPVGKIDWEKDDRGRKQPTYSGKHETVQDNPAWVVDQVAQRVRRAGALVSVPAPRENKPNATSERYNRDRRAERTRPHDEWAEETRPPAPNIANRKGARAMATLNSRVVNNRIVRTGVNNLRFMSLDSGYDLPEDNSDQQRVVSRRGEVLSFITLSTRAPLKPRPGRAGMHVLRDAAQKMDARVRGLILKAERERSEGFERDAYLEVLRSALGRAL